MASLVLEGFGDPLVNGFYEQNGDHDGKPFYIKDTGDHVMIYRLKGGGYGGDPAYYIEKIQEDNGAVPIFVPKYKSPDDDALTANWSATGDSRAEAQTGTVAGSTFKYKESVKCGCEGKTTPRVSVTISWNTLATGPDVQSYDIFGCTYFNGQTKEVCATSYSTGTGSNESSFEVWEKMGGNGDPFADKFQLSNNRVGDAFFRKKGRAKLVGNDILGNAKFQHNGTIEQTVFPYLGKQTLGHPGLGFQVFDTFKNSGVLAFDNFRLINGDDIKPVDLFGSIVGDQFGSITTTGGLTVKWSRLSPAESVDTSIDYWVSTSP